MSVIHDIKSCIRLPRMAWSKFWVSSGIAIPQHGWVARSRSTSRIWRFRRSPLPVFFADHTSADELEFIQPGRHTISAQ